MVSGTMGWKAGLGLLGAMVSLATAAEAHAGFAAAGEVTGLERIQADIVADAPSQFVHVLGLEWPLSYLGSGSVTLKVNPVSAFQVTESTAGPNLFTVKLISTAGLTTPFGAVVPLSVEVFGRGGGGGQATDEIGVQFVADNGVPIDLSALSRDPAVRDFSVVAIPSDHVQQIRTQGSQVIFKRLPGYGTEPVKIKLGFSYQGIPYAYMADLPTKDDGMVAGVLDFIAFDPVPLSHYAASSMSYSDVYDAWEAADKYKDFLEGRLLEECNAEIEYGYDEFDRCEEAALRKGYRKGEYEFTRVSRQPCNSSDIPYIEVPESVCHYYSYNNRAFCAADRMPTPVENYKMNNRISCSIKFLKKKP